MAAPSPPDYTLELLKIAGTFLSVWGGATLAWRSASRGRREDLLIKERYKLFETQVGYIYEANFAVVNLSHGLSNLYFVRVPVAPDFRVELLVNARGYVTQLREVHDQIIRNQKVTIFNHRDTSAHYSWSAQRLLELVYQAEGLIDRLERALHLDIHAPDIDDRKKAFDQMIVVVRADHAQLLKDLYRQQEFSGWIKEPALLPDPDDINPHALKELYG